jgi:hypothetical protein
MRFSLHSEHVLIKTKYMFSIISRNLISLIKSTHTLLVHYYNKKMRECNLIFLNSVGLTSHF